MKEPLSYLSNRQFGMLINGGAIEWLCLPKFDSYPIFASIVNRSEGGHMLFFIVDEKERYDLRDFDIIHITYLNDFSIVETVLKRESYIIEVNDFIPRNTSCFIRSFNFYDEIPRELGIFIKFIKGYTAQFLAGDETVIIKGGPQDIYLKCNLPLELTNEGIIVKQNNSRIVKLHFSFGHKCSEKHSLSGEMGYWSNFLDEVVDIFLGQEEIRKVYRRSLQVLHNLIYEPTGAILAAPTSSIPDTRGLDNNWDYRFCWIRDSSFCVEALSMASAFKDAKHILDFLYSIQDKTGGWTYPVYTIDGEKVPEETILDIPEDYGGKFRLGNNAGEQFQIDSEGAVLNATLKYYQHSGDKDYLKEHFKQMHMAADVILEKWPQAENGIWEFRDKKQNYVYGKAICASGLQSFLTIANLLNEKIDYDLHLNAKNEIMKNIDKKGFSASKNAYIQSFESDVIDASVLILTLEELIPVDSPKMRGTIKAIIYELDRDGGIARYPTEENPFYLTTFWLTRCYIRLGMFEKFFDLLSSCIYSSNMLGLMGEHFYPKTLEQRGNFPQSFSHEEYIHAVLEGFLWIDREFKVNIPINIFKSSTIRNFNFLGQNISMKTHLDKGKTRVYLNTPENIVFKIPKVHDDEIKIEGGEVTDKGNYFEFVSRQRKVSIIY
ncbi:MAG: glycoside hydrolase family 15 protein [Candidatus Odinarchaeia archaeon]